MDFFGDVEDGEHKLVALADISNIFPMQNEFHFWGTTICWSIKTNMFIFQPYVSRFTAHHETIVKQQLTCNSEPFEF